MVKGNTSFDVFITHNHRDVAISTDLAKVLRSYDLKVFTDDEVAVGENAENAIWEAMSESHALVAVIPETDSSASFTFELGAAKAWNKPIFAVASSPTARLPAWLKGLTVYPPSRIEEIAQEIKKLSESLSESDQASLVEAYHNIGVPVDRLMLEPEQLAELTKQFQKRTKRTVASEVLVRTLLRLRKQGKLRQTRVSM